MEFLKLTDQQKETMLNFLGFFVNNEGIICSKENNKIIICPYSNEPVRFKDASIMPGSTVIFNTSALNLARYFSEYIEEGKEKCLET